MEAGHAAISRAASVVARKDEICHPIIESEISQCQDRFEEVASHGFLGEWDEVYDES